MAFVAFRISSSISTIPRLVSFITSINLNIPKISVIKPNNKALLAIMVVDIQREYRFYSEKEEIRLQKTMDIRRKYVGIARRVLSTQNRPAVASDLRG